MFTTTMSMSSSFLYAQMNSCHVHCLVILRTLGCSHSQSKAAAVALPLRAKRLFSARMTLVGSVSHDKEESGDGQLDALYGISGSNPSITLNVYV